MPKRLYRNNGRHGKFGKDVETVVISRRVPKAYVSKICDMFDTIIQEEGTRIAMSGLIQLVWDLWPFAHRYCEDKDAPEPMFDVCMVLPSSSQNILYLSVGRLTGLSIQPIFLKESEKLNDFIKMWKSRIERNSFGDSVEYGETYIIGKGVFGTPTSPKTFPLDHFKSEVEGWFGTMNGDIKE